MRTAWHKLMREYQHKPGACVGDVDCTAGGKSLCAKQQIRGYPTLLYGEPDKLQKYEGERDYESLSMFAGNFLPQETTTTTSSVAGEL
mmetsp:Transcript_103257/g.194316  ORF Transcript_103257/g.194316 Transcript_103257/m.194316 type:complete len:88 (+) Transcript_103257:232-495(+)